jgi:MFS family permease
MTSPTAQTVAVADAGSSSALISPQRRNFIFWAIMLGMLLAALDQTIVATALPTIVADLGGAGHQSWVVTSYLLASTIITALVGRLGDLFGRKSVFQAAVVFFVVGSVLCGISQSMVMLVGSRALQGIGGGRSRSPPQRGSVRSFHCGIAAAIGMPWARCSVLPR